MRDGGQESNVSLLKIHGRRWLLILLIFISIHAMWFGRFDENPRSSKVPIYIETKYLLRPQKKESETLPRHISPVPLIYFFSYSRTDLPCVPDGSSASLSLT